MNKNPSIKIFDLLYEKSKLDFFSIQDNGYPTIKLKMDTIKCLNIFQAIKKFFVSVSNKTKQSKFKNINFKLDQNLIYYREFCENASNTGKIE